MTDAASAPKVLLGRLFPIEVIKKTDRVRNVPKNKRLFEYVKCIKEFEMGPRAR